MLKVRPNWYRKVVLMLPDQGRNTINQGQTLTPVVNIKKTAKPCKSTSLPSIGVAAKADATIRVVLAVIVAHRYLHQGHEMRTEELKTRLEARNIEGTAL